MRLCLLEYLEPTEKYEMHPEGTAMWCYRPDNSRQRVGVVGEYRLAPGEKLIIKAPHGVTGSVCEHEKSCRMENCARRAGTKWLNR